MKYLKLFFIFIFGLLLYGCNNDVKVDEVIDKVIETIPFELDSDLEIPSNYTFEGTTYHVSFSSTNEDVIDNQGKVYRGLKDINSSIILNVEKDDKSSQKEVYINVKGLNQNEVKDLVIPTLNIDSNVTKDLDLPTSFEYNNIVANLTWISSNQNIITNSGKVTFKPTKQNVTLSLKFSFEDIEYMYSNLYFLEVEAISEDDILDFTANNISLQTSTNANLNLPTKVNGVTIVWSSSNESIISSSGKFKYPIEDTQIELRATFLYSGKTVVKNFNVTALAMPHEDKINLALASITFPEVIKTNLNLKTVFDYNVTGTWKSNNPDIINDNGFITLTNEQKQFSITLILKSGDKIMEKEFILMTDKISEGEIYVNNHHHLGYATDFNSANFSNVVLEGDRLVLAANATMGSYESPIFKTINFTSLVGSWAAISSKTTTAELKVRVRVNGTWSNYLSYGTFGLGLQNKMINQSGGVARLVEDELMINDSKSADAFQYQVVLRRDSSAVDSAKLSLVSIALQIPNYKFNVDITDLPKKVEYDLPNLYQIDVPVIGNSICSPTSATMLLMYHGHKFEDSLPHREVANLFKEYNTGIFGNWVFNTVGMSAYGENSYVKRIYSIEELFHHLATVGPVALSIRGNTGLYTTNGHLIVVSGYEITESGRSILVHDPNVSHVEVKYSEALFNGFTRNVIYVMESK